MVQRVRGMYNERLINEYYLWLLDLIDYGYTEYGEVTRYLFNTEFTWLIDNDANRASDGMNLRYEFVHVYGGKWCAELDFMPVNCLEVLVALAINWEHEITYDFTLGDRSPQWFWMMLDNLGLLDYPDGVFNEEVEEIVRDWLERKFDKFGNGSPFPRKSIVDDQRKVEIWMQLQGFVMENVKF